MQCDWSQHQRCGNRDLTGQVASMTNCRPPRGQRPCFKEVKCLVLEEQSNVVDLASSHAGAHVAHTCGYRHELTFIFLSYIESKVTFIL